MLAGIIIVTVLMAAGLCGAIASLIGIILNFKKDNGKIRANVVIQPLTRQPNIPCAV